MRILQLTIGLGIGGAEKVMSDLARGLKRDGHDVEVLALKRYDTIGGRLRSFGIKTTVLGAFGAWDPRLFIRAAQFFKHNKFDIIHAHCLWACVIGALFKGKAKLVWHEHMAKKNIGFIKSLFESLFFEDADLIVTPSKAVRDCFIKRNPKAPYSREVIVIQNGIWLDSQTITGNKEALKEELFGFKGNPFVFGFVGRTWDEAKGCVLYEWAARKVYKTAKENVRCVVIGHDSMCETDGILYLAQLGIDYMKKAYQALDVLVIPSREEGLPLVLLEGMANGLPVIASSAGGIPEVLEDGIHGKIVDPINIQDLADAMVLLLKNKDIHNGMAMASRNKAHENFSFEKTLSAFTKHYNELNDGRFSFN